MIKDFMITKNFSASEIIDVESFLSFETQQDARVFLRRFNFVAIRSLQLLRDLVDKPLFVNTYFLEFDTKVASNEAFKILCEHKKLAVESGNRIVTSEHYSYDSMHSYYNAFDLKTAKRHDLAVLYRLLYVYKLFSWLGGIELASSWLHVDFRFSVTDSISNFSLVTFENFVYVNKLNIGDIERDCERIYNVFKINKLMYYEKILS